MVSVIKGQSQLETLYCIMLFVKDKGSGLPVMSIDAAADGVETSRHGQHCIEDRRWEEVLAGKLSITENDGDFSWISLSLI